MKIKTKIRRRCKCGCGRITNPGNKYIYGHNKSREGTGKTEIRRRCKCGCGLITKLGNKYIHGHNLFGNTNAKGYKQSEDHILKRSISRIKYDPDYEYDGSWQDIEYRNGLRKDYCENINCKGNYKKLDNHHIDLDKRNSHPLNIMTLCHSCHSSLHNKLQDGKCEAVNLKDFLIINRVDHISYINKKTRKKITIYRIKGKINNAKS